MMNRARASAWASAPAAAGDRLRPGSRRPVRRPHRRADDALVTASIEYGPLENATPLIVVLGHAQCGAVAAAVRAIQGGGHLPGHLDAVVERLRRAYLKASSATGPDRPGGQGSDPWDRLVPGPGRPAHRPVNRGDLGIVGAYYDLDTGLVTRLHALGL